MVTLFTKHERMNFQSGETLGCPISPLGFSIFALGIQLSGIYAVVCIRGGTLVAPWRSSYRGYVLSFEFGIAGRAAGGAARGAAG
jgi:hypothetical protein